VADEAKGQTKEPPVPIPGYGRLLIGAYLIGLLGLAFYAVVALWPNSCGDAVPSFLIWSFPRDCEQGWLLLVFAAGMLGGLLHALRSFYWYVGNRELVRSWAAMYLFLPFVGGTLGVVFYIVIRGGLFSGAMDGDGMNPIGFAAVAGLVGLFSEQAVLKLKDVANTLFKKPSPGEDDAEKKDSGASA
jgi:hypothetical protein